MKKTEPVTMEKTEPKAEPVTISLKPDKLNIEKVEKVSIEEIEKAEQGIEATIKEIKKGRLIDLAPEVFNMNNLSEKQIDFINKQGDRPYLLIIADVQGSIQKFLVHYSFAKNSKLYELLRRYESLEPGKKILVKFDQDKKRFTLLT